MSTGNSVTDVVCSCGYLERAANNPDHTIEFDARLNEYQWIVRNDAGEVKGKFQIYHCPFCGGAAPQSFRASLFAAVTHAEDRRLQELVSGLTTIDQVVERLGPPDDERPDGTGWITAECSGEAPTRRWYRTLTYRRLSGTTDLRIIDYPHRRIGVDVKAKYIGPPDQTHWAPSGKGGPGRS